MWAQSGYTVSQVNAVLRQYGFTQTSQGSIITPGSREQEFPKGSGCHIVGRQSLCSSDGNSVASDAEVLKQLLSGQWWWNAAASATTATATTAAATTTDTRNRF